MSYWPWWLGSIALATITLGFPLWTGRTFGISGLADRVLAWRDEREVERMDAATDLGTLRSAMAQGAADQGGTTGTATLAPPAQASAAAPDPVRPLPVAFAAVMLGSVFVGGLLAAVTSGRFEVRTDMGPDFAALVTDNPVLMVVVLFVGGVMVGFGTRMAGGCTSGHGLTGCSRLHPVSLLATATFFGTAVVVSTLLWKVI